MEYTAPYTPEQNGVVERAFANVQNMGYAMMLEACFSLETQGLLWTEAMNATTSLANITATSTYPRRVCIRELQRQEAGSIRQPTTIRADWLCYRAGEAAKEVHQ